PSADLWAAIERAIGAAPVVPAVAGGGLVDRLKAFWADVRVLRIASVASVAAALLLAVLLVGEAYRPPARPTVVAVLHSPGTQLAGAIVEA
ncbi:hypothetical protein, partial [Stenotrophomonas maltophilia]|uniref:hypothetical protein n=1 Tax=Stenotrophomonas maltophilia TaxID=40324 RepID=UPI0019539EDD